MSKLEMLTPQNSAIALIDYQPAMYQGVQSHDRLVTFNNVQVLAKAAKLFGIPTVISTIAKDSFSGPFMPEVTSLFPQHVVIDRTAMNGWLDANFRKAVNDTKRKKIDQRGDRRSRRADVDETVDHADQYTRAERYQVDLHWRSS